ncbi:MAG: RnfABCDGE type electron transport complex subunit D [Defluviitaleaceae bacterium]|nr:RnfABCDGE type electron transport complex subunit D [Defluviitaleaceae bacterium]
MSEIYVSASPHIRSKETSGDIMLDVLIALTPAAIMGAYYFGARAVFIVAVSVASAILAEVLFCAIVKSRGVAAKDLSAAITGLLLGLSLPVSVPLWLPAVGSVFAIIVVKQLFGGIGHNFINPALGARAFLLAAYPHLLTNWSAGPYSRVFDAFTGATPLAHLSQSTESMISVANISNTDLLRAFHGNTLGSIGETCVWALLLGFTYLLVRRVISWQIPVTYITVFAALMWILGRNGMFTGNILYEIMIGSLLIGAIFMATDYTTSPITKKGRLIFAAGCGVLHAIFRLYGGQPEGTTYAILLMNIATPLINRLTIPRKSATT